jgi:transposase
MKTFKPYNHDQLFLLPPALRDWLPEGHLALFVSDVVDALDLTPILAPYADGDGRDQPPYHPALMVKLLVYGYCTGKPSSRRIEKATYEEVPYRVLAANQHPDYDSLAAFRQQHSNTSRPSRGCSPRCWRSARELASSAWATSPSTGPRSWPTPLSTRP